MDIMQLGALGELVGGVAVIGSLIYVGFQIRQNTAVERAETHRSTVAEFNHLALSVDTVEAAGLLRRAYAGFDALSGEEQVVIHSYWGRLFFLGQQVNVLAARGVVDPELEHSINTALCAVLQAPGSDRWWRYVEASKLYSDEYVARLNTLIAHPDGPAPIGEILPWYVGDRSAAEGA